MGPKDIIKIIARVREVSSKVEVLKASMPMPTDPDRKKKLEAILAKAKMLHLEMKQTIADVRADPPEGISEEMLDQLKDLSYRAGWALSNAQVSVEKMLNEDSKSLLH